MKKDIEWLKEKIKKLPVEYYGFSILKDKDEYMVDKDEVIRLINQLDDPEVLSQELPGIPKYVAEYLEVAKKGTSLIQVMELANMDDGWPTKSKERDWISANDETFARAWLDGYEVEEEKYYVMNNHNRMMLQRMTDGKTITEADPFKLEDMYEVEKKSHRLTEQEIKDYDERYWPFAVPVEVAE